jgi:hypothetical protein
MLDAMGLSESTHIFDKLRVLRSEGAEDELLRRIGVPGERDRYLTSRQFRLLQKKFENFNSSSSIIDDKLIAHLMIPRDPGRGNFLRLGINGGHHDRLLHDFVNNHPQYIMIEEAKKAVGHVVYRKYSQYCWKGRGRKPKPHDSRFPRLGDAAASTYDSDWGLAKQRGVPLPKTTFSSLQDFLPAVDEAWWRWCQANKKLAHSQTIEPFTFFSEISEIQVSGFFDYIPPDEFSLRTSFVEASWFSQNRII